MLASTKREMKMPNKCAVLTLFAIATVLHLSGCTTQQHIEPIQNKSINVDDLNKGRVTVIGKLGLPVATLVTIEGNWQSWALAGPPGRYRSDLVIRTVDGKPLEHEAKFDESEILSLRAYFKKKTIEPPHQGCNVRALAFENLRFKGMPLLAQDMADRIGQYNPPLNFKTELVILNGNGPIFTGPCALRENDGDQIVK